MSDQPDKDSTDADDTKQAPPSGEEPETTVVASDTTTIDREELAWSLDNTDEIQSWGHGRIVSAGLVALLVGATAVITWLAATYFTGRPPTSAEPPAVSTTTTKSQIAAPQPPPPPPAPAPAPPATTVQASPSTVQLPPPDVGISPEMVAWYDQQFIANLRYNGAVITDPVALAHQAHRVCAMLQKGTTREDVIQKIVTESGWNYFTATMFTSTAMSTYPDCP